MEDNEIQSEIDLFASWPLAFTFQDLIDFVRQDIEQDELHDRFIRDERFIRISGAPKNEFYISKISLFKWYVSLNSRLASADQFKLRGRQLTNLMSHLRRDGRWESPPTEMVNFAYPFGLIAPCLEPDCYVFPLSKYLTWKKANIVFENLCDEFEKESFWKRRLKKLAAESLRISFSEVAKFDQKAYHVGRSRFGLGKSKARTLQQLANSLGYTRERIRQVEVKFLRLVRYPSRSRRLIITLICDFIIAGGSHIRRLNSPEINRTKYLFRIFGIPYFEFLKYGILIFGITHKEASVFNKPRKILIGETDSNKIASFLESKFNPHLSCYDIKLIAQSIAKERISKLGISHGILKSMRTIGGPAHYSKITQVYNSLFPGAQKSERNIHAFLSSHVREIVWIGSRGTYALKEWGFDRPSMTIFDTVTKIVKRKFRETRRPISMTVIKAEIGKYRKIVRESSLSIAASLSPGLESAGKNSFIPRIVSKRAQAKLAEDENINQGLEEFLCKTQKW